MKFKQLLQYESISCKSIVVAIVFWCVFFSFSLSSIKIYLKQNVKWPFSFRSAQPYFIFSLPRTENRFTGIQHFNEKERKEQKKKAHTHSTTVENVSYSV